jgi:hypothetical protein
VTQTIKHPSGYNAYKFFLVMTEPVFGSGNFDNRNICLRRCTVSEAIGDIGIGQAISKAVNNEYGLKNTGNVFVGIGYGSGP